MALVYQLEKEFCGESHIKKAPENKVEWSATQKMIDQPTDVAGFYLGRKEVDVARSRTTTECSSVAADHPVEKSIDCTETNEAIETMTTEIDEVNEVGLAEIDEVNEVGLAESNEDRMDDGLSDGDVLDDETLCQDNWEDEDEAISESCSKSEDEEEEDDDDDDDGGGWITPSNIANKKRHMMQNAQVALERVKVACLTTDFAIQNVLLQMGLNVVSVDGLIIKRARSFVLRCHACMKITKNMMKQFCPHCGNHTLKKVSVTVNEDGSLRYFLSKRKPISTRGMRFSLPRPQGGKHANNPILTEDQRSAQQRPSKKSLKHLNITDPDYKANTSPFSANDVTSRAAILGIRGSRKNTGFRNPNMNRRGRRK